MSDELILKWKEHVGNSWVCASTGDYDGVYNEISQADELGKIILNGTPFELNPELSVLRYTEGGAKGVVRSLSPSEDVVLSVSSEIWTQESPDAQSMQAPVLDQEKIAESIRAIVDGFDPGFHAKNITKELPHTMVLSTGRCGTVSLYHLLESSQYISYHTYFFHLSYDIRNEMAYRLISGNLSQTKAMDTWLKLRAAEWLGAISQDRPMMGLNHLDTVFAPVFAAIHKRSRFIHLHRDPIKVFESFYGKNQWNQYQINPLYYAFDPDFRWRNLHYDTPIAIAWYVRFTEVFARAMGDVMGDRYIELSSDKLFVQDDEEIKKFIEFNELDMTEERVKQHFSVPYNQKKHKISKDEGQMNEGRKAFIEAYQNFGGEL